MPRNYEDRSNSRGSPKASAFLSNGRRLVLAGPVSAAERAEPASANCSRLRRPDRRWRRLAQRREDDPGVVRRRFEGRVLVEGLIGLIHRAQSSAFQASPFRAGNKPMKRGEPILALVPT